MENVEVGKKYIHFKGHKIEVIAIAKHSATANRFINFFHMKKHIARM